MVRRVLPAVALAVFLAATLASAIYAVSWSTAQAITNCSTNTGGASGTEDALVGLINSYRQQNGLSTLKKSPNLFRAAAWMSEDIAAHANQPADATHKDYLGRAVGTRTSQCGYPGSGVGENLAWGFSSPQSVFDAWKASPGHNANLLGPNYQVIGVGNAGSVWTADFGTFDDSSQPWDGGAPPPPTSAPPTSAPPTSAPPTSAPPTSAPPTSAPPTSAPKTVLPIKRVSLPMLASE